MLKPRVHAKIVQEILGHATISTTLDTYSHVSVEKQNEAHDKYSQFIKQAMPTEI